MPASRTPEGSPNVCPVCGNSVKVEPSSPTGDAPCPSCGQLLWFIVVRDEPHFYVGEARDRIRNWLRETLRRFRLGEIDYEDIRVDPAVFDGTVDSMDIVELVMELDAEFRDEEAA